VRVGLGPHLRLLAVQAWLKLDKICTWEKKYVGVRSRAALSPNPQGRPGGEERMLA